jgi:hypothetical protein
MYTVWKNITGRLSLGTPEEEAVDIKYYSGDSLAQAMSALATAAAELERDDTWYRVNSVRMEVA